MGLKAAILGLFLCVSLASAVTLNSEKVLINALRENYRRVGTVGRPVAHTKDTLKVKHGVTLLNINSVCHKSQTVAVTAFAQVEWNDIHLTWDPKEFGGLEQVRIPIRDIWIPDMMVYNNAEMPEIFTPLEFVNALVKHDGHVIFVPSAKITVACPVSHPSDQSEFKCSMMAGSWTYDSSLIDMEPVSPVIDLSFFNPNPNWELVKTKVTREEKKYECCPELYVHLDYELTLKHTAKKSWRATGEL